MNDSVRAEVALIERLLTKGQAMEAKWWVFLQKRFFDAGWIELSKRKQVWNLCNTASPQLEARLSRLWPTREHDLLLLQKYNLNPFDPKHLEHLPALREETPQTPKFINRRTWFSISGIGPKNKSLKEFPSNNAELTHDAITRFRPNAGLVMEIGGRDLAIGELAMSMNEFALTERGLRNVSNFKGTLPNAIVTIENLGSYIDLIIPSYMLVIYSPGDDLRCAVQLLKFFPEVKWIHFGDIDPEGFQIAIKLAKKLSRPPQIYVPSFAGDYLKRTQKREVAWENTYGFPFIAKLKKERVGIFQEIFMLDSRLSSDLEKFVSAETGM